MSYFLKNITCQYSYTKCRMIMRLQCIDISNGICIQYIINNCLVFFFKLNGLVWYIQNTAIHCGLENII